MATFEQHIEQGIKDGVYPGCVVVARDKSGKLDYAQAFGKKTMSPSAEDYKLDTPMQVASMTKLITTIACLQLVERGSIGLDDDVAKYIPELIEQGVMTGLNDSGDAITEPIKNAVTLRLLLTHSAGCIYDFFEPRLAQIKAARKMPAGGGTTFESRILFPLNFQPGTSWDYGTSVDWAGRVLERVTGGTLDAWAKQYIFAPLGIRKISFWPQASDALKQELAGVTSRDLKTGGLVDGPAKFINESAVDDFGGHGTIASIHDYSKILYSLLMDDEKLMSKQTAAMMFSPQLSERCSKALNERLPQPQGQFFVGDFPDPGQYDWGFGGMLVCKDNQGRRKKGTLMWSGMPNCFWFIDRAAGVCAVFGTQVMPPADDKIGETIKMLEYEMNKRARGANL